GHRPCAECRRDDFNRFRDSWAETHPVASLRVDDIDHALHAERVGPDRTKRLHDARLGDLPDGSMIALGEQAWLLRDGELLAWSPFGYGDRRPAAASATVDLLTPPSIVDVIRTGYAPTIHPTAG